jgi:hypothetical protein
MFMHFPHEYINTPPQASHVLSISDSDFAYCSTDLSSSIYFQLSFFRSACQSYVLPTPMPTKDTVVGPCGMIMVRTLYMQEFCSELEFPYWIFFFFFFFFLFSLFLFLIIIIIRSHMFSILRHLIILKIE